MQRRKPQASGYKITSSTRADGGKYYSLRLHPTIAELIPEEARFQVELIEEGILYRRIVEEPPAYKPSWVFPSLGARK